MNIGWMCGGVAHSQKIGECTADYHKHGPWNMKSGSLGVFLWFRKLLYSCNRRNVTLLCTSTQRDVISFIRPPPTIILQVTNAGMRRPGYETNETYVPSALGLTAGA